MWQVTCGVTRAVAVVYTYIRACVSCVMLSASRYNLFRLDSALSSKLILIIICDGIWAGLHRARVIARGK